jgi:hypothetical protein
MIGNRVPSYRIEGVAGNLSAAPTGDDSSGAK